MRSLAVTAGWLLLAIGCLAFLYAMYLTGGDSVLGGLAEAVVLGLAVGAVGLTSAGLVVATRGFAERSWLLFGGAVVMHVIWYAVALGVAETA